MNCIVVGLIPPDPKIADYIRNKITTTIADDEEETTTNDTSTIEWRPSYSVASDADRDGATTLLLTAITKANPELVIQQVKEILDNNQQHNNVENLEFWASAPAPLPLRPLDGYERHVMVAKKTVSSQEDNQVAAAVLTMKRWGLLVQKQILSAQGVRRFRAVVDDAITDIDQALAKHQPQLIVGRDTFCFREIASRNKERFDLRLTCPKALDLVREFFLKHDRTRQFIQQSLGVVVSSNDDDDDDDASADLLEEEIDFDLSVVYSRPGAGAQGWHADGAHMAGALDAGWKQDGWQNQLATAYAVCLFVPLIDLNQQVGYTQFWPASHQHRDLIGFGIVAELTNSVWNGNCMAGDGIWYDYRLLHQGMPNTTHSSIRPIIQIIFKRKWYVERANYGVESLYNTATNPGTNPGTNPASY